jgi:hypothetical protein
MEDLVADEEEPVKVSGKKGGKNQKGAAKNTGPNKTMRLAEVSERLEQIGAHDQETKAIAILTGIGFS